MYKDFFKNRSQLKNIRIKLRKEQTKPESLLWFHLRNKKLGYKFRRQFSIGNYIVDFYCHELKLVIEVDGSDHINKFDYDIERQKFLKEKGFIIIRYSNQAIINELSTVLDDISEQIKKIKIN